jgi:hypothetical protein
VDISIHKCDDVSVLFCHFVCPAKYRKIVFSAYVYTFLFSICHQRSFEHDGLKTNNIIIIIEAIVKGYIKYFLVFIYNLVFFFRRSKNETTCVFHHSPRCGGTSLRKSWMAVESTYKDYRIGRGNFYPMKFSLYRLGNNDCLIGHIEVRGIIFFSAILRFMRIEGLFYSHLFGIR